MIFGRRSAKPKRTTWRPPLCTEHAVICALILGVAWVWSEAILDRWGGHSLTGNRNATDGYVWAQIEIFFKTGPIWLIGGIGALIYWPIFLIDSLRRVLTFFLTRRA
jgi:hypothetical protein